MSTDEKLEEQIKLYKEGKVPGIYVCHNCSEECHHWYGNRFYACQKCGPVLLPS